MGAAAGARGGARRRRRRRSTRTRGPRPGLLGALAAALDEADLVSAGARFVCDAAGERLLHPAMLATLVYRYGPADAARRPRAAAAARQRAVHGGAPRGAAEAGGYAHAAGHMTDDAALARGLAAARLAGGLPSTRATCSTCDMHDVGRGDLARVGALDRAGRRDAAAPGGRPTWRVVWLDAGAAVCCALAAGRADAARLALLAVRCALLAPLAPGLRAPRGAVLAVAAGGLRRRLRLTLSALRPARRWRGRVYAERRRTAAPMNVISAPVAATCATGSVTSWTRGKANTADAGAPREAARDGARSRQSASADRGGERARARTRRRRST